MTAQEILDNLDTLVKAAEARNVAGHEPCIRASGKWSEKFPGKPKRFARLKDENDNLSEERGIWILTLDEARDLRDYLTDNLNSARELEEAIGPKRESAGTDRSGDAVKRLILGVKGPAAANRRRGKELPWEGA